MHTLAAEWCTPYSVDLLHVSPANGGHKQTLAEQAAERTRSNISWFLWHPACSHSLELTFIPPRWSRLNQKHTAWPLSATAYYVWLPGQNAKGGLNLHHHSINRKHWCPGRCAAYNETTLKKIHTSETLTTVQSFMLWYMERGEPMWFEVDIN